MPRRRKKKLGFLEHVFHITLCAICIVVTVIFVTHALRDSGAGP